MIKNFKSLSNIELNILSRKLTFKEGDLYPYTTYVLVYPEKFELIKKVEVGGIVEILLVGGDSILDNNDKEFNCNEVYKNIEEGELNAL